MVGTTKSNHSQPRLDLYFHGPKQRSYAREGIARSLLPNSNHAVSRVGVTGWMGGRAFTTLGAAPTASARPTTHRPRPPVLRTRICRHGAPDGARPLYFWHGQRRARTRLPSRRGRSRVHPPTVDVRPVAGRHTRRQGGGDGGWGGLSCREAAASTARRPSAGGAGGADYSERDRHGGRGRGVATATATVAKQNVERNSGNEPRAVPRGPHGARRGLGPRMPWEVAVGCGRERPSEQASCRAGVRALLRQL
jgi:hypothetical protein